MTESNVYLIGIAGGAASGKSQICDEIVKQLRSTFLNIAVISLDSFYRDLPKYMFFREYDFDHPRAFDWDRLYETLLLLKYKYPAEISVYNYITHGQMEEKRKIQFPNCIILRGTLVLYDERIRELLNMKIFVDTPSDQRLLRKIRQDLRQRGRNLELILDQYERTVAPGYDRFVEPTKKYADHIIPNNKVDGLNISTMITMIKNRLRPKPTRPKVCSEHLPLHSHSLPVCSHSSSHSSSHLSSHSSYTTSIPREDLSEKDENPPPNPKPQK